MTRKDLAKVLAQKTGLTQIKAEKLIINFGKCVEETLAKGEKIVYSNFGTFYTVHYPSKIIYHPKLGKAKKMIMLPTNAVKWMPSGNIKEMVKNENAVENATAHGARRSKVKAPDTEDIEIKVKKEPAEEVKIEHLEDKSEKNDEQDKIYVETVNGGKEVATFDGAIRVRRNKDTFLNRIFGRKQKEEASPSSLDDLKKENDDAPSGEKRIDDIKSKFKFHHASDIDDTGNREIEIRKDIEITPFKTRDDISFINLKDLKADKGLLKLVPKTIAREYKAVPVEEKGSALVIAMADPKDYEAKEIIKKLTGRNIIAKLATEDDINSVLSQYDTDDQGAINPLKTVQKYVSDNAPAARIMTALFRRALRDKASDIHIDPKEDEIEIKFRIDGKLIKKSSLPSDFEKTIASRIKMIADLDPVERSIPQNGRFSLNLDGKTADFLVSIMPASEGERIVIKVLDRASATASFSELGMRNDTKEIIENALQKRGGIVLICGPKKSGKTTTLYSLINKSHHDGINIITIEDPIAYKIKGITQSQVDRDKNYSYIRGLSSIVRQDPDIIVVGSLVDKDTAELAAQTSLNGHTIFTVLEAKSAINAVLRLTETAAVPSLPLSGLNIVIGQKLVPKICPHCKEKAKIGHEDQKKLLEQIKKLPDSVRARVYKNEVKLYEGKGCEYCGNTGKKGVTGLFEVLKLDSDIKEMFLSKKSIEAIEQRAAENGMITVQQDGLLKAISGIIALEDALNIE